MPSAPFPNRIAPWIVVAFLVSVFPVLAQSRDSGSAANVEFRVTRFDPDDREPPVFKAGRGDRQVEIEVPLTYIAGPFKAPLRDGRMLDFFHDSGEKPVISLEIKPAEREHLLLVFFQQEESFRVLQVHTPPNRLKGGDRYLLNATDSRLAVKLGNGQPVLIDTGKSGVISSPGGSGIRSLPVLISRLHDEEWKLASTENWHIDPRIRSYLFAYISPRTRHLAFHVVSERL